MANREGVGGYFAKSLGIVADLGAIPAFRRTARSAEERLARTLQGMFAKRYWEIDAILNTLKPLPHDLPSWMRPDPDNGRAIMVHPGGMVECGYAITPDGDILRVESLLHHRPGAELVVGKKDYLRVSLEIIDFWKKQKTIPRSKPKAEKPKTP